MRKKPADPPLGNRERQLMDAIYHLEEASVTDVLEQIPDPPSYSAVRKMLNVLEQKGLLTHRREGTKYLYRPTRSTRSAGRSAIRHLLETFFAGTATDAVNTILDVSAGDLTDEDFDRLRQMIDDARKKGQ